MAIAVFTARKNAAPHPGREAGYAEKELLARALGSPAQASLVDMQLDQCPTDSEYESGEEVNQTAGG